MGSLPTLPRLPDGQLDAATICPPCTKCCRYVSVGIDSPDTVARASTILWLLYHKTISVYEDVDGNWFMVVPTDCENLRPDGLCGIYDHRPIICRDYEIDDCEGTSDVPPEKTRFDDGASLLKW